MSQYKIQSRPFNDERLPYSGRSLAANRENRTRVTGIQIRVISNICHWDESSTAWK